MYSGPAVLETPLERIDVRAELWMRPPRGIMLGEWGGTLVGDDRLVRVVGEGGTTIVLPDGRRGDVVIKRADPDGRAVLAGKGSPPT